MFIVSSLAIIERSDLQSTTRRQICARLPAADSGKWAREAGNRATTRTGRTSCCVASRKGGILTRNSLLVSQCCYIANCRKCCIVWRGLKVMADDARHRSIYRDSLFLSRYPKDPDVFVGDIVTLAFNRAVKRSAIRQKGVKLDQKLGCQARVDQGDGAPKGERQLTFRALASEIAECALKCACVCVWCCCWWLWGGVGVVGGSGV